MTAARTTVPADAEVDTLHRVWLQRHSLPNAYSRWREADETRAPVLAFTAVACEPLLLERLGPSATSLVVQAEKVAIELLGPAEVTIETRAAAQIVKARVTNWRNRSKPRPKLFDTRPPVQGVVAAALPKQLTVEQHLRVAADDYPFFRESTARPLFLHALQLGAGELEVVAPFDHPFMLATARYAARGWRGAVSGDAPAKQDCATMIGLVQDWGSRANGNPFLVDFSRPGGSVPDLLLSLSRDVAVCVTLASQAPGGVAAPGFGMWEDAEEYLAFGVMSLCPSQLRNMDMDGARIFAAAAARLATAAVENASVTIPIFPEALGAAGARSVLASTRCALPDGIEPRRSAR